MLVNIQFLRFAAALMVVFYHAARHVRDAGADPGPLFAAGEAAGFAGVDIFFVISGFIMFYTTREARGALHAADFLNRRFARIYSGYWPFFVFAALVFAWARPPHFQAANLGASFVLWPQPLNRVLLDVSWTLSYEMYFYLLFTLLVLLGVRARLMLLATVFTLFAAVNLGRHFLLHDFAADRYYTHTFAGLFLTSPFLLEFFAGALLAALPDRRGLLASWLSLALGVIGLAAAAAANQLVYGGAIEQGYHVVPRVLLFGIPSVLLLNGLAGIEHNGYVAPKRFSLYTGGASYALYLSHTIFFVLTMGLGLNAALRGWPDLLIQLVFLLYSAGIVAYSVMHYRFIERPLHRAFRSIVPALVKRASTARFRAR